MRFSLTRPDDEYVSFRGRKYRLTLYFDRVLEAQRILSDETFSDSDCAKAALFLLCEGAERLSNAKCAELLEKIFCEYINPDEEKDPGDDEPMFDFEQDAEYIFSSFIMDYGINLHEQKGRLLWHDFIALFKGLSERTKMREIISIRARKLPAPNKYNSDEIRALTELKRYYALKIGRRKANTFSSDLAGLAEALKQRAVINNGRS